MDTARVRSGPVPADRAGAVVAVLRTDISRAVRHGLLTSSESAELLARLTMVVDQAVDHTAGKAVDHTDAAAVADAAPAPERAGAR